MLYFIKFINYRITFLLNFNDFVSLKDRFINISINLSINLKLHLHATFLSCYFNCKRLDSWNVLTHINFNKIVIFQDR